MMIVTSLAWREAVELTGVFSSDAKLFGEKGFQEPKLPIELIVRFQRNHRPSARIPINRMGDTFKDADPQPQRLLEMSMAQLQETCQAGRIPYEIVPHPHLPNVPSQRVYLIAATDYADWLLANKYEPSIHIAAWFHETKVNFAARKSALQRLVTIDEQVDPLDRPQELDIANLAFHEVIVKGYGLGEGSPKQRLLNYIEIHYGFLTDGAKERIATLANPDKASGRRKNSGGRKKKLKK